MIDIENVLNQLGIDFKTSGKNVGSNDLNVDCPFCGAEKHLGISKSNCFTNCWVCDFSDQAKRPSIISVLREASGLGWKEVKDVLIDNGMEFGIIDTTESSNGLAKKCYLPEKCYDIRPDREYTREALEYLSKRKFNQEIIAKHNLKVTDNIRFSGRIIIPIYKEEKLVAFVGRDYTGKSDNRYKNSGLFESSERIKNLLYNYDSAYGFEHIYLLEGPTDCWRMGDDSAAVFRSRLSPSQRNTILGMNLKSISIIFDPGATERAYLAAESLSPFIPSVRVVRLQGKKDVSDRTRYEILKLESKTPFYRG